jgi:hypothetical protein
LSLTSITLPNTVTTIGDAAFKECTSLTSITLPDSVTTIGQSAFYGCHSLTYISVPASLVIPSLAFEWVPGTVARRSS